MNDLKQRAEEKLDILKGHNAKLKAICNVTDSFNIRPSSNYDDVRIIIQHPTLQWTDSAEVTIGDNGEDTFSYSGGGFVKEVTTLEKLQVTKDTVVVIEDLLNKSTEIRAIRKLIYRAERDFRVLADELSEIETEKVRVEAEQKLLETHRVISVEEIMNKIDTDHDLMVTSINVASYDKNSVRLYELLIENRGNGRANYYYQDSHYSKEKMLSMLNNGTLYTVK